MTRLNRWIVPAAAVGLISASAAAARATPTEKCTTAFGALPGGECENVVDVDLFSKSVLHGPKRMVISQNEGLIVRVRHAQDEEVTVTWDGTRGLVRSEVKKDKGKDALSGADMPTISVLRFPPRRAGSTKLTLEGKRGEETRKMEVEIEIEELYWGAVRIGLGTLFDVGDQWRGYEIATFAGSRQPEIRETHSAVSFEIVNGFAPYLFDIIDCGGRSQTGGCNWHVAPYIGYGIVGASPSEGIAALTSFQAGLEVEFASNLSLALTFVMRRTSTLADGYFPGSPVSAGMTADAVTETTWRPGFGVVLSASPEFLQFARSPSRSSNNGAAVVDESRPEKPPGGKPQQPVTPPTPAPSSDAPPAPADVPTPPGVPGATTDAAAGAQSVTPDPSAASKPPDSSATAAPKPTTAKPTGAEKPKGAK